MRAKLALTTLCEDPASPTGLSTLFPEFIAHARRVFPDVSWVVFAGRSARPAVDDPAVDYCTRFPSNERPLARILSDQMRVAPEARRRGAEALLTVGMHPLRDAGLPVAMHVFAAPQQNAVGSLRSAYRSWAVRRGMARAALVITNSAWARAQLPRGRAPVIVSAEGLRHDVFAPAGPKGIPGVDPPYLLWVSNLYPYKRLGLALAAYAALPAELRRRFPFVVVGGDWKGGRAAAESEARRLGIADRVRFLGWVADGDLPALYRGAQAHVLATSQETFGRTVLEAMACGCPNVVQDIPVLREVAGGTAQYADFARPEAAAALLAQVCLDPGRQAQLAAAGVERARAFSFERLARERVGAVLSAIGKAPA
jgi:glycosyltransferase involved in cell wall biosynthesis